MTTDQDREAAGPFQFPMGSEEEAAAEAHTMSTIDGHDIYNRFIHKDRKIDFLAGIEWERKRQRGILNDTTNPAEKAADLFCFHMLCYRARYGLTVRTRDQIKPIERQAFLTGVAWRDKQLQEKS